MTLSKPLGVYNIEVVQSLPFGSVLPTQQRLAICYSSKALKKLTLKCSEPRQKNSLKV